ncbi:MAG: hypothetical protein DIU70_013315 [Bacillota bacterium]
MVRLVTGWAGVGLGLLGALGAFRAEAPVQAAIFAVLFAAGALALARRHWPAVWLAAAGALLFAVLAVMTVGPLLLPGAGLLTAAGYDGLWGSEGPESPREDRASPS